MAPKAKQDSLPDKTVTQITQTGLTAYNLATKYAAQLTGRLGATLVADLGTNLTSLGAVVPAAITAHDTSVAATATQNTALEAGYQMLSAVRLSVTRNSADPAVRKAYGVGAKTSKLVVKDVKNGLQLIVNRATANATEAAGLGILPADVTRYTAQIAAVDAADQAQEKARASAPATTKQRNTTARQILAAVDAIAGAGAIAFDTSPTERALFEALVKKAK
jgi:hypothetical protein